MLGVARADDYCTVVLKNRSAGLAALFRHDCKELAPRIEPLTEVIHHGTLRPATGCWRGVIHG